MYKGFLKRLEQLESGYEQLIRVPNETMESFNGIYRRYRHAVLTHQHTPIFWRYDLNYGSNPHLMERFGINAVFNAGAIKWQGKYIVIARVEGTGPEIVFCRGGK